MEEITMLGIVLLRGPFLRAQTSLFLEWLD